MKTYQSHENLDKLFYSFLDDHNHALISELQLCEHRNLMLEVQPNELIESFFLQKRN